MTEHEDLSGLDLGLMSSVQTGDLKRVKKLIGNKPSNVHKIDEEGYCALHYASRSGYEKVVEFLLESGAEIDFKTPIGSTSLSRASFGGHIECVKILVEAGADVNTKDRDKETPLIKASKMGRVGVIKYLLEKGAKKDHQNKYGETAYDVTKNQETKDLLK
ncbi:ankyrin repeat [Anaeramoeba flamelloides]|uniref:Ankyrin repeat n=1 Tax=Anaeramoeba flamelloides TaxID=1746091 RepID=A0ABQ8X2Z5_9EUKA|nr:ankyrin repeat [Anaeramoeba flamelloides]